MKKLSLIILALVLSIPQALASGKIYAVIMGATLDKNIGQSCIVDLDRFDNELSTLSCLLEMELAPIIRLDGSKCDRPNMESGLNQLKSCSRDDIIFFYYTGHGMRSPNDKTQWPQMCMNYNDQRNWVPVHDVIDIISPMRAHLKLILTDCCNVKDHRVTAKFFKGQARGASYISEVNYGNLEKLFIKQNGCIIATGSQVDEPSLSNDEIGGAFTLSFWASVEEAATGEITPPSWQKVLDQTVQYTRQITNNKQTPIYQLPNDAPSTTTSTPPTPTQPVVVGNANVNQNMTSAITVLLNRNLQTGYRLKLIPDIINTYFASSYVKVQTVGRDMQTIVDTEEIETFLRRITLDKKMRQINVITENKDGSGKCSYLKVHEVRNPLQQ